MTLPRRIVAIGGGGFLMDDASLVQERYLVSLCRRPQPSVLYLGTAGGDGERAQLKFMTASATHEKQTPGRPKCFSPLRGAEPAHEGPKGAVWMADDVCRRPGGALK